METTPREEIEGRIEEHELKIRRWTTVHRQGGSISDSDIQDKPAAVTESLADAVRMEESVDVTNYGIEVVPDQ